MKINFIPFKPIKNSIKKQQSAIKFQTVPLQNDVFIKNAVIFKGDACSTSNFKIKTIENLHCPVCGYIMLNPEQQEMFVQDVYDKKGEDLAKTLEKYEDESIFTHKQTPRKKSIFNPQRQQVVNIIKNLALKHPDLDLAQLVQLQANSSMPSLIEQQLAITTELKEYVKQNINSPDKLQSLNNTIFEHETRIKGKSPIDFSRKVFIYEILKIVDEDENKERINEIVSKLPNSKNDINSFFVKYSKNKTSKEIALKIIEQSKPTAEHLFPESKGGANSISNYICDCAVCNNKRRDLDFFDWQKEIPNFQQRLQEYLKTIQAALDNNILPDDYDSYIPKIIETIRSLSGGHIILYQPDSTLDKSKANTIATRNKTLISYEEKLSKIIQEKTTLETEIRKIKLSPYYQKIASGEQTQEEAENEIKIQISQLSALLAQEETIRKEERALLENSQLAHEIKLLEQETRILSTRNARLEKLNLANADDNKDYEEYLHTKYLYQKALEERDNYLLSGDLRKCRTSIEILNYALRALRDKMTLYEGSKTIEYFTNIEKMAINKEKTKKLEQRIQKNEKQRQTIQDHIAALNTQLGGRTIEDVKKECQQLTEALEMLENIKNLPKMEKDLETLKEIIHYNADIIKRARNIYKKASNKNFDALMKKVYI